MKKSIGLLIILVSGVVSILAGIHLDNLHRKKSESFFEEGEKEVFSEYLGYVLWKNLSRFAYYDINKVIKTLYALENGKINSESCQKDSTVLARLFEKAEMERSNYNLAQAEQFLEKIKKNENIIMLKSNKVFYEVLRRGDGKAIIETNFVYIHFKEMDIFQHVLRDTTQTKDPVKIKLSETIPGLRCATKDMTVGEKRRIYIHPELAYGSIGKSEPNQLSIFEIEIISD